jgi:PhnB protein
MPRLFALLAAVALATVLQAAEGQPVPDAGIRSATPYLILDDTAAAIEFYKKAFGATELMRVGGQNGSRIEHAEIKIGDSVIMLNDENPISGEESPKTTKRSPVYLLLEVEEVDACMKRAIDAGAKETMKAADQPWGARYGKIDDPFGHHWAFMGPLSTKLKKLAEDTPAQAKEPAAPKTEK